MSFEGFEGGSGVWYTERKKIDVTKEPNVAKRLGFYEVFFSNQILLAIEPHVFEQKIEDHFNLHTLPTQQTASL